MMTMVGRGSGWEWSMHPSRLDSKREEEVWRVDLVGGGEIFGWEEGLCWSDDAHPHQLLHTRPQNLQVASGSATFLNS